MKRIRLITIRFDAEIAAFEIPAFRAAIAEKAGFENTLFHNHHADGSVLYRYPSIQYKRMGVNPAIICIEDGVDEIHHFFQNRSWDILLGNREVKLKVSSLNMNQVVMQVWEKTFDYTIRNWLPLSQENYKEFIKIDDNNEQKRFLEKKLVGNIISMAKGIKWDIDKEIKLKITELGQPKMLPYKKIKLLGFDARFKSNVFLPNWIGLGKGVSIGMGIVRQVKEQNDE